MQSSSKGFEGPEAEKLSVSFSLSDGSDTKSEAHSEVTAPAYSPIKKLGDIGNRK